MKLGDLIEKMYDKYDAIVVYEYENQDDPYFLFTETGKWTKDIEINPKPNFEAEVKECWETWWPEIFDNNENQEKGNVLCVLLEGE